MSSVLRCAGHLVLRGWRSSARALSSHTRELPKDASVVIIGGGAVGTSIAYHLAKKGCRDVLLLEMAMLTAGSTWHAAGLVTSFHPLANVKSVHQYSLDLFPQLERETGQAINFHNCGSIRVATSEQRAEEMRYQVSRNRSRGNPARLLTAEEVAQLCPLVDKQQVALGLHTFDGHLDPYSLTQAYATGARMHGARIEQGVRVTRLSPGDAGGWTVGTPLGTITADTVVNAAGFYAREVGQLAGYNLPLVAVEHQYMVSSSLPEVQKLKKEIPVLRHMEASSYIRMERDGLLVGVYEMPEIMKLKDDWYKEGVPKDFSKQLFEDDVERSESYLAQVMDLMPCLKSAQIQSVVNGPITYAPDGLPIVGPHTLPDMWLAVGFGFGIIHSGGIGNYLSDYIMTGEPQTALIEFDPGRYQDSWLTDVSIMDKVKEAYGLVNVAVYPHDERFAGRPSPRVTPARALQEQRGARFLTHAGWEQPAWFAGEGNTAHYQPAFHRTNWQEAAVGESQAVMTQAGIIDLTPFGKCVVRGGQASQLLARATANSVPKEGRCVVTHMLTERGTIYAELTVSCTAPDTFLVVTGSGSEVHDFRWLQNKARKWNLNNVSFANVTEDIGCLGVVGPKAREILKIAAKNFPEKFPFFGFRRIEMFGVTVEAIRLSYTGEDGWELYHPRQHTGRLYQALLHAGQPLGLNDFGTHALNILRMEKGFRGWGAEMTLDTNMVEAGMTSFVDWKKGDFNGRTATLKQLQEVPQRSLVQVALESPHLDPMGDEGVWKEDRVVGTTTSGSYSPHLGCSLAFCYLPPFLTIPGTQVQVDILDELLPATVIAGPPVLTHGARARRAAAASSSGLH